MIEAQINEADLERARALLGSIPKGIERAVTRAINKTAVAARTKVVRRIAAETSLLQKSIRKAVTLRRASWRVWQALIRIRGRPLPLLWFRARQTRSGVTFALRRGEGRKTASHAFIQTMPATGHRGVFRRFGPKRRVVSQKTGRSRLAQPIKELRGPSISEVFTNTPGLVDETIRETGVRLKHEFDVQVALLLRGVGTAMPHAPSARLPGMEANADLYAYLGSLASSVRRLEAA